MIELRCKRCNALLAKEEIRDGCVEIKCYHCNTYNIIDRIVYQKTSLDRDGKCDYNDYNN